MTQGTSPPIQMMKILPGRPMPNQKMVKGIQATGGMGRMISKMGRARPSAITNHPMARPRGIPTMSERK